MVISVSIVLRDIAVYCSQCRRRRRHKFKYHLFVFMTRLHALYSMYILVTYCQIQLCVPSSPSKDSSTSGKCCVSILQTSCNLLLYDVTKFIRILINKSEHIANLNEARLVQLMFYLCVFESFRAVVDIKQDKHFN